MVNISLPYALCSWSKSSGVFLAEPCRQLEVRDHSFDELFTDCLDIEPGKKVCVCSVLEIS